MPAEIRMRRTPPPELGPMLAAARMRHGWSRREAARILGLSSSYLFDLECGRRCPSVTIARQMAEGLGLDAVARAVLFASAVADAGRDHPAKRAA